MKKLFIAVFTLFLCITGMAYGWAPMDNTTRSIQPGGQQYFDIATESQKPYMEPYICFFSANDTRRTETFSYSTYDLDLRDGNFKPGVDQLFYFTKDKQTFTMIANKGFITPGKNTGVLIFKSIDADNTGVVRCRHIN